MGKPTGGAGYIVICDIVGFSLKKVENQIEAVNFLSGAYEHAIESLKLKGLYVNCTGDGFLCAIPVHAAGKAHESALRLCESILESCKARDKSAPALEVRFGIHRGDYQQNIQVFGGNHILGKAPNHAARVATIGDASHIVVSRDFFNAGVSEDGVSWGERFSPEVQVWVKHDQPAEIRWLDADGAAVNREKPTRLRVVDSIDGYILETLVWVSTYLCMNLGKKAPTLRPRVSLYLPSPDGKQLICRGYRYHWNPNEAPKPGEPTKEASRHSLDPAKGPLAAALVSNTPVLWTGLPEWYHVTADTKSDMAKLLASEKRYIGAVEKLSKGSPASAPSLEEIRLWRRHPWFLFAVPFSTARAADPQHHVRGVVCIDGKHDLDGISRAKLDQTVHVISSVVQELAWSVLARKLA